MKTMKRFLILISVVVLLAACNKSGYITEPAPAVPTIKFDNGTGVYQTKVGREVVVAPIYTNVDGANYAWRLQPTGRVISTEAVLKYTFDELNADDAAGYYLTLEVTTREGSAAEDVLIEVVALMPPIIAFALPAEGLYAERGRSYTLTPDVQNSAEATYEWLLQGSTDAAATTVGRDASYTFASDRVGDYSLTLKTTNEDGTDSRTINVTVVDAITATLSVAPIGYLYDGLTRTVALGRSLTLRAYVGDGVAPKYSWTIDDAELSRERTYTYHPTEEGTRKITLTVTDDQGAAAAVRISPSVTRSAVRRTKIEFTVVCCKAEGSYRRPSTASSSVRESRVYEYTPAPGQFINELAIGGFTGAESTQAHATAYAEGRFAEGGWVSLGGWGGYIVVGFDHSIENSAAGYNGGYNFSVQGNQFRGSSEPGVVWVMQDTNGNMLPDDEWYELKGSESGKAETLTDYAVTYYRPSYGGAAVRWRDNRGATGCVDHVPALHKQPYYYPAWVATQTYTLYGTCLKSQSYNRPGGDAPWVNEALEWGYADNYGSDRLSATENTGAEACKTYFKIANAVDCNGAPVQLKYIDFVRVQTGVNAKAGALGEVSTEVFGFVDENINQGK